MANEIFDKVRTNAGDTRRSFQWFQNQVRTLAKGNLDRSLMSDSKKLTNTLIPGEMYLFYYDPKHKETLPYFDRLPLVLPFRRVKDGFYGINIHYMPYLMRYNLLAKLSEYTNNDKYDDTTRLRISWSILTQFSRSAPITESVKHYLSDHIKSRFLRISYPDWVTVSQLPIEQFEGANKTVVWRNSRKRAGL